MWESPIKLMQTEIQMQLEGDVMKAVQNVGVMVDKEELLRALQYDREQYSKGYCDGYSCAIDEFLNRLEEHTQENWVDHQEYGITWADIELIAEQMKGGAK